MFDVASSEVIILGVVALLVIPPKDLPKAMRTAGYWIGRVRGVATQFRSGFDSMLREAELHEMEKKWAAENERIMREHPPTPVQMLPSADSAASAAEEDAAPHTVEQPVLLPPHDGPAGPAQPAAADTPPAGPASPASRAVQS
ncbi:twin-arginine translocase subunit TatB [Sphingomonas sp. TREG-RG-20F-R18-01]|uniref:twin-arginine translocase subunit TatB n=1 Tax=Sphingomonas sp. TREG-RG-20F-R18-01 TaxID=2914982 RepID=UPI001F59F497|nr:twin-arginine translocase subunit TatB [Sphingomonas sp. TREG-RG-20F-R18-01]